MGMHLEIFGKKVGGYGLFIAIGVTFVILYLKFQKYYKEMDFDASIMAFIYAFLGAGIGAKVLYWVTDPKSFFILFNSNVEFMKRFKYSFASGLVFLGGLIGAGIGIYIFLKLYKKMDALMVFDLFAISITILHMFGRMGCFMAGCCYGTETVCWFGVSFPQGSLAPYGVKLIPTQLLGVFGNLFMFIMLIILSRKNKKPGILFALYLVMYSVGRFIIEFFRGDELRGVYGFLSTSQWLTIPLFMIGLIMIFKFSERNKKI